MSITFHSNATSTKTTTKEEPCLCAQMADCWYDAYNDGVENHRGVLAAEARSNCPICEGTGVESREETDHPEYNLCNDNATALLRALGLKPNPYGELSLADARRGLMRARNRSDFSSFERPEEIVHGAPRTNAAGVVEMRPLRSHDLGLDAQGLLDRIEYFSKFVEQVSNQGGTAIFWD